MGLTMETVLEKFYIPYRLCIHVYDRCGHLLEDCSNILSQNKRNKDIRGTVYCLLSEHHVYRFNKDVRRLQQITDDIDDTVLTVSNRYYIPQTEEYKALKEKAVALGFKKTKKGAASKVALLHFLEEKGESLDDLNLSDKTSIYLHNTFDFYKDIDFSSFASTTKIPRTVLQDYLLDKCGEVDLSLKYKPLLELALAKGYKRPQTKRIELVTDVPLPHLLDFLQFEANCTPKIIGKGNNFYSQLLVRINDIPVTFINPPLAFTDPQDMFEAEAYVSPTSQENLDLYNLFMKKLSDALYQQT